MQTTQVLALLDDVVVSALALQAEQFDQKPHGLFGLTVLRSFRGSQMLGQLGAFCQQPRGESRQIDDIARTLESTSNRRTSCGSSG
jgi:hypothetical protein